MILVDTNIPLRLLRPTQEHGQVACAALDRLRHRDESQFVIAPQSLYEMHAVLTRPVPANGYGYSVELSLSEVRATRALFTPLTENDRIYSTWERLIGSYDVQGKRTHDVRLVAMMLLHSVPTILTFNDRDFRQFNEISVLNPFEVMNLPRS